MAATRTLRLRDSRRLELTPRTALKWGAPVAYVVALVVYIAVRHFSIAKDEMFLWIAGALLAGSITQPRRFLVGILLEWLPFAGILLLYDLLRGYADGLLFPAQLTPQLHAEQWLFGGQAPTVWLQHQLFHGVSHLRWYDYASWGVYMTHFLATLILAVVLWLFAHHLFRRYIAMVSLLALVGFATYVLYPAVPPWMAAQQGHLEPVTRIVPWAWSHIHVFSFDTLFETGSKYANDVAAMPSLHAAYSLLITLFLWGPARRWWWRVLLAAYPLAMAFALVYTAEHFFIDVAAGWLYAVAVFMAVNETAESWAIRRERRRSPQPLPQSP